MEIVVLKHQRRTCDGELFGERARLYRLDRDLAHDQPLNVRQRIARRRQIGAAGGNLARDAAEQIGFPGDIGTDAEIEFLAREIAHIAAHARPARYVREIACARQTQSGPRLIEARDPQRNVAIFRDRLTDEIVEQRIA